MQPMEVEESKEGFVRLMWDDNYCKICFLPMDKSPINCGHLVHMDCQLRAGPLCVECKRPFRLTRWMDRMIAYWRSFYRTDDVVPES